MNLAIIEKHKSQEKKFQKLVVISKIIIWGKLRLTEYFYYDNKKQAEIDNSLFIFE